MQELALAPGRLANNLAFPNPTGEHTTWSTSGAIKLRNPFFRPLGTNGRACVTCHRPEDAWSVGPPHIADRFEQSGGLDPLFRTVDTSNNPSADVSTVAARRVAYSHFLARGVVRFRFPLPPGAEFRVLAADDPYGNDLAAGVTVFRRPLPSTNVKFLADVMWDGREPAPQAVTLDVSLASQANAAHRQHAEATRDLTAAQAAAIVEFEKSIFTAQFRDQSAGLLRGGGGRGGARNLSGEPFAFGDSGPFTLYDGWPTAGRMPLRAARAAVRRGQVVFNTRAITISGVAGLNDELRPSINGTCVSCHDAPNIGSQSVSALFDIGVASETRRTADQPLYTLFNEITGEVRTTTDPGRALVSGRWSDIGRFKSPVLRGLAGRAPYFHDGSAETLEAVVDFYDGRFQMGMSAEERSDLTAFLRAL